MPMLRKSRPVQRRWMSIFSDCLERRGTVSFIMHQDSPTRRTHAVVRRDNRRPAVPLLVIAAVLLIVACPPWTMAAEDSATVPPPESEPAVVADAAPEAATAPDAAPEIEAAAPETEAVAPETEATPAETESTPPEAAATASDAASPEAPSLNWITDLEEGFKEARERGRPVIVYGGAEWCGPCKLLRQEMKKPAVAAKLAKWTLVYLDVDHLEGQEGAPAFSAIPALILHTPAGRVIDSRQGFIRGEELIAWLEKHHGAATAAANPDLTAPGAPDAAAAERLATLLGGDDAELQAAVTRRLLPHSPVAAVPVAERFAEGNLAERLAALELLQGWDAPVEDIDPWRPETVTEAALTALRTWAAERAASGASTRPSAPDDERSSVEFDRALDRLLRDDTNERDARAVVERLAQAGPSRLPVIHQRLAGAVTDEQRRRLNALRYRLAASDERVLRWGAGLDRLATADPAVRRAAAEELAKQAGPDDAALLSELFADADPLVREISLRGLRGLGGGDGAATAAIMARLLGDPNTNVRAAVLKELAAAPTGDREVVKQVVAYAATEIDPDLLVHAVRFLREAKSVAATRALVDLVGHESWRVRAEAAEALGAWLGSRPGRTSEVAALVLEALTGLLQDPDGFVASRAVAALQEQRGAPIADAMIKAVELHPELAVDVVEALSRNAQWGDDRFTGRAAERLRTFCKHPKEAVRAAAIAGLCNVVPDAGPELAAALADPAESVRLAAAVGLNKLLERQRPGRGGDFTSGTTSFFGTRESTPRTDQNEWLDEFRAGTARPEWFTDLLDELEQNLAAKDIDLRIWAAVGLTAAGADEKSLPVLRESAKANPTARGAVASALPWLPWEARLALFNDLLALGLDDTQAGEVARQMGTLQDPRAAAPLWAMLERPAASGTKSKLASSVMWALQQIYLGDRYYDPESVPAAQRRAAVDAAAEWLAKGNEVQRVVGLALLVTTDQARAAAEAQKLYDSPATSEAFRLDALHVLFSTLPEREASALAVSILSSPDAKADAATPDTATPDTANPATARRTMALTYLAAGARELGAIRGSLYLQISTITSSSGQPEPPKPPPGLTAELLRPLAADKDGRIAAYASYLLCVLGEPGNLEPLLQHWRQHKNQYGPWRRMVYGAVACLNDDALTPILEEVYASYDKEDYDVRNFYWTIRSMKGPAVLQLRKRIRDEVGMDRLR